MDPDSSQQLVVVILLLVLSAFFSLSEAALTSLSKIRLKNLVKEEVKNAARVDKLLAQPKKLLSSILFGNSLVVVTAVALMADVLMVLFQNRATALVVTIVCLTFLILIFVEIIPRILGAKNSDRISLFVAIPIGFFVYICTPFVTMVNILAGYFVKMFGADFVSAAPLFTESELITMVNVGHEEGVLEVDERRMITNVFEFGDYCAKDMMTPRTNVVAVEYDSSLDEVLQIFEEEQFSRMPVYKETMDNIVGIIYFKDVVFLKGELRKSFCLEQYLRTPYFTYESKPTSALFTNMRTKSIPMAIVLDEYGGTSGVITLEDLVEQIVGEISDEYDDAEQDIVVIKEDEFIVEGITRIADVNEMIGTSLESEDFDSIGGFVMGIFGRMPEEGETILFDDVKFIVEALDKNRIAKLRIYT